MNGCMSIMKDLPFYYIECNYDEWLYEYYKRSTIVFVTSPISRIKQQSHVNKKKQSSKFFFCIYVFMVFVLTSTGISTESLLYQKVPSYRHVTYLHF